MRHTRRFFNQKNLPKRENWVRLCSQFLIICGFKAKHRTVAEQEVKLKLKADI